MKKNSFIFILMLCLASAVFAQTNKSAKTFYGPSSCNCTAITSSSNMWVEGNARTSVSYILQLQISPVAQTVTYDGPNCTPVVDSIFFWTTRNAVVNQRKFGLNEFVKTYDAISADKKWRIIRIRIMKSLFRTPPIEDQPFGVFYKIRFGNKVCEPFNDFKITNELL